MFLEFSCGEGQKKRKKLWEGKGGGLCDLFFLLIDCVTKKRLEKNGDETRTRLRSDAPELRENVRM